MIIKIFQKASEMINFIQSEFKNIVRRNAWMDEPSKEKALEKVKGLFLSK